MTQYSNELDRRLAAIFYADVEGYTRLTALDEVETHRAVTKCLGLVAEYIESHHGRVGHYAGDAVLADFDSAKDAVTCAVSVQRDLAKRNQHIPDEQQIRFRIGINFESVIVDHGAVHGGGVNVAARVQGIAEPGGICISGTTYDAVLGAIPLEYEFLGEQHLKNLHRPVRAYRVILDTEDRAGRPRRKAVTNEQPRPGIVVLPFEDLRPGSDAAHLCSGLTQDITTDLAKFPDLLVVSAKSAFLYKGQSIAPQQLGQDLGARYALAGSVLRSGDRVRVSAQLIETATGVQLWSERFDRDFSDIFTTQDELAQRVVSSISVKVGVSERAYAIRKDPNRINAYDAFLRGNHHWWQFVNIDDSMSEWAESKNWFEHATRLDPTYARPWAWSAYSAVEGYRRGWSGEDVLERAEEWAKKAVKLDRDDYDGHWSLGYCYLHTRRFEQANAEYNKAYQLNPNDPDLIIEMAETLTDTGMHQEAVAQLEKSMTLNPQCADFCRSTLAWALYFVEKYGDSLLQLSQINKLSVDDLKARAASHARNAQSFGELGQNVIAGEEANAAQRAMRDLLDAIPDWTVEAERKSLVLKNPSDEEHWLEGLRLAGLPEGR